MKKRQLLLLFLLCLPFVIGSIWCLTPLGAETDLDDPDAYNFYPDIPRIYVSNSGYLLDPDFKVTSENFADCTEGYFSALSILYFGDSIDTIRAIKSPETAKTFSAAFHNVPLTQISEGDYPWYDEYREIYHFYSAVGNLSLRTMQDRTYISFFRNTYSYAFADENLAFYDTTYFYAEGNLISELKAIGETLENDSKAIPDFEVPH